MESIIENRNELKKKMNDSFGIKNNIETPRENCEKITNEILKIHGIPTTKQITDDEVKILQKLAQKELDYDEFMLAVSRYGEKNIIRLWFNGNRYEYQSHLECLKSIKTDLENAVNGESGREVSDEEGRLLLNTEHSTQTRVHTCHFNNDLGDNAGFVSRNNMGYVYQLFADGYLRNLTPEAVQDMIIQEYGTFVNLSEANSIANEINKARRTYEGSILQGQIGDSRTTKNAISVITSMGKKDNMSFEHTDTLGRQARKICKKFDNEAGKIIGQGKTKGNCEELNKRTAKLFSDMITETNQSADDVIVVMKKILRLG